MTYYGGKEIAAAFRTVRGNTIKIAEEIPERQVRLPRRARHAVDRADARAHRARPDRSQLHMHGNKITDLKTVNFPELMQKLGAEEAKPRTKAEIIAFLKSRRREVRLVPRRAARRVPRRAASRCRRATEPATKSRFEMLLGAEGARDAPSRPADADASG